MFSLKGSGGIKEPLGRRTLRSHNKDGHIIISKTFLLYLLLA